MTVLLEIVDDDHLTRLNRFQKPPRRGWALRGGALFKDGRLLGGVTELPYEMKPRSTELVVELRYTPIRELLNRGRVLLQAYIDALGSMDYHTYLKTRQWHHVRWVALAVARRRCQVCDHTGRLEVHHRTYERRGMESADDITVLCRDCHGAHHERTRARR